MIGVASSSSGYPDDGEDLAALMAEYFGDELVTYSGWFLRVRYDDPGCGNGMVVRTALDDLGPSAADARDDNCFRLSGLPSRSDFYIPACPRACREVRGLITPDRQ